MILLRAPKANYGGQAGDHVYYEAFFVDEPVDPTMFVEFASSQVAEHSFLVQDETDGIKAEQQQLFVTYQEKRSHRI